MKKVFYSLFALTVVLASCQQEELEVIKPSAPSARVYCFELTEGETRAALEEEGVFWEAGDQVGLYPGSVTSVAADVNAATTPKTVTFTSGTPLDAGTPIYAYYPYQTGNTNASATKIVFPAAQTGGSVSAMPMAGVPFEVSSGDNGTDGVIRFLNLGAVIDFRVYSGTYADEQVQSITFEATSGDHPVSGEATIDLTGVTPGNEETLGVTWPSTATGPSSVTLSQSATVAATKDAAAEGHLYMVVAPGTYSGTISITTNAATYYFSFSNRTLTRSTLSRYNMKLDGTSATRAPIYSIENDKLAQYMDYVKTHPYGPRYPADYSVSYIEEFSSGTGENNRLDWPKPVPVSWETAIPGTPTVLVYNDELRTSPELTANVTKTSDTSADIYSLIPGRNYWYVVKDGDTEVATGRFATTGRRRMIKVAESQYGMPYANNCRDFGGMTTVDGKTVRFGKIYRGSNMNYASEDQKTYIRQYMGVGLDVDLRQKRNIYDSDGSYQKDALGLGPMHTEEEYYNWNTLTMASRMASTLSKIFDAVVNKKTGVYIHCKVGADRTGYVCLLLQAILGVCQDQCDMDYEMTSFSGAVGLRTRGDKSESYYYYPRGVELIFYKQGNTFQEKAITYVTSLPDITLADVQAFQEAMLED